MLRLPCGTVELAELMYGRGLDSGYHRGYPSVVVSMCVSLMCTSQTNVSYFYTLSFYSLTRHNAGAGAVAYWSEAFAAALATLVGA